MANQFWHSVAMRWRILGGIALLLVAVGFLFDAYDLDMYSMSTFGLNTLDTDPPPLPPADEEEYVAFCLAVKDQHLDLPEFLKHHYFHLGIRRFYVMDDGSIPPLSTTIALQDHGIDPSAVTFDYFPAEQHQPDSMQHWIYNRCHAQYGQNHTWMAFVDADEFFEVVDRSTTFVDFLKGFEHQPDVGALAINWQIHTSNGHLVRQDSCREAYTTCIYDDLKHRGEASDNKHIKSIVKMADFKRTASPHTFDTGDKKTVGEDGKEYAAGANASPWRQPITRNKLSLHHYAVKSRQEYEDKMERGNAMGKPKGDGFWNHIETMPHVACPAMAKYYP